MPKGVYERAVILTADEKKELEVCQTKRYRERHREQIKAARKRYQAENQDRLREKSNRYYAEHQERMKEQAREYHAEHRDAIAINKQQYRDRKRGGPARKRNEIAVDRKQYHTKYYRENRELLSARKKKYAKDHPEVGRRKNAKRRAVKRNATIGDPAEIVAWEEKWRSKKTVSCHWCSKRIKTSDAHVDHVVPLSKGGTHSVENFCVSCETCNLSKHNKLPDVWNAGLSQPLLFV